MRKIGAEIASGVAIFLAFVLFVFGFLFLKNTAFKSGYSLFVRFQDVTGLEPHDVVNVSGLKVGQVENFELQDLAVVVEISIDEKVRLPKDSKAQIRNLGLVGEKFIEIVPGDSSEYLSNGEFLEGSSAGDFSRLTGSMEGLIEQAQNMLNRVVNILESLFDQQSQKNLQESLSHLNRISSTLDQNSDNFEETIGNLQRISTNVDGILTERRSEIEASIHNLAEASGRLETLASKMDSSLTSLQAVLSRIENQEGTIGKVIASDELYNDIRELQAEIDAILKDLKKYPQKYVNLKVF